MPQPRTQGRLPELEGPGWDEEVRMTRRDLHALLNAHGDRVRAATEDEALPSVERLARALHATGLNSFSHRPGTHGRFTTHCICNFDAADLLAALRADPA